MQHKTQCTKGLIVFFLVILVAWFVHPWGKGADVFFFTAALLLLFWMMRLFSLQSQERKEQLKTIEQLLSHQRHDWMNHIQVLTGYDSLQKYDRMKPYIQKMTDRLYQEREISKVGYVPLVITLLALEQRYRLWNVNVAVDGSLRICEDDGDLLVHILSHLLNDLEKRWGKTQLDMKLSFLQENSHAVVMVEIIASGDNENDGKVEFNVNTSLAKCMRRNHMQMNVTNRKIEIRMKMKGEANVC